MRDEHNPFARFRKFLRRFWPIAFILAVLVSATMTLLDTRVLPISQRSLDELFYYSAEFSTESGPTLNDYRAAASVYQEIASNHFPALRNRGIAASAAQQELSAALKILGKYSETSEDASNTFHSAALVLNLYVARMDEATRNRNIRYGPTISQHTREFVALADKSIEELHWAVISLDRAVAASNQEHIILDKAKAVCLASRKAGLYLQLVWPEYMQLKKANACINDFVSDLIAARTLMDSLVNRFTESPMKEYSHNISRRISAVQSVIRGNFKTFRQSMLADSNRCRKRDGHTRN